MGVFKLKSKIKLDDIDENTVIQESDFAHVTPSGNFVQLKYIDDDEAKPESMSVKPGLYTIVKTMTGLQLEKTSFVTDKILDSFIHTENITSRIDSFFRNTDKYAKYGIEVPKRSILLFGRACTGKTTSLIKATNKYVEQGDTIAVVWPTDKYEAYQIKDFIKTFEYTKYGVKKLILIVEDIGGVEVDQVRKSSDSSLLSLLDNQEKTFKIPVFIIATTNHPEIFLGNLTNRPGRFNDKIEVGVPGPEFRKALFKFFAKDLSTPEAEELIMSNKCKEFTADHIREVVIRSDIYEKDFQTTINEMLEEIELYNNMFSKKEKLGF